MTKQIQVKNFKLNSYIISGKILYIIFGFLLLNILLKY